MLAGPCVPWTATEARLDESEELNALANLSTVFWLPYQIFIFVFTSIFPIISFQSSKDATSRALIVKCDGQRVQHRCRCRFGQLKSETTSCVQAVSKPMCCVGAVSEYTYCALAMSESNAHEGSGIRKSHPTKTLKP